MQSPANASGDVGGGGGERYVRGVRDRSKK